MGPGEDVALAPAVVWSQSRTHLIDGAAVRQVVAKAGKEMLMWEALRQGVDEEMERDATVCVMGATCLATQAATSLSTHQLPQAYHQSVG